MLWPPSIVAIIAFTCCSITGVSISFVSTLTKQTQNNGLNPLKTLQMLLGHSNLNTTMIYLESLSIDLNEIEDSLTKFYGDII